MRSWTLALALLMLFTSATVADARGGRTTSEDCEPGSPDPDCPDQPPPPPKKKQSMVYPGGVAQPALLTHDARHPWFLIADHEGRVG